MLAVRVHQFTPVYEAEGDNRKHMHALQAYM